MNANTVELTHFLNLSREEQANAIRRMAALGWTDYGIAAATRLSVEFVRRVLSELEQRAAHPHQPQRGDL